jgi:hypothetical protein
MMGSDTVGVAVAIEGTFKSFVNICELDRV